MATEKATVNRKDDLDIDEYDEGYLEWMSSMKDLARREGIESMQARLQSENEHENAMIDEYNQVFASALEGKPFKEKDHPNTSAKPSQVAAIIPSTTIRETTAKLRTRKPLLGTTYDNTNKSTYRYFKPSVHTPFLVEGSFDIPEGKVQVLCVKGPSNGKVWQVEPMMETEKKRASDVKIGRSQGKAYKTYGLSLSNDAEVSTYHATIIRQKAGFYYKDMKSSNGSSLALDCSDQPTTILLEPLKAYKLINGMQVRVGQHVLQFNF